MPPPMRVPQAGKDTSPWAHQASRPAASWQAPFSRWAGRHPCALGHARLPTSYRQRWQQQQLELRPHHVQAAPESEPTMEQMAT